MNLKSLLVASAAVSALAAASPVGAGTYVSLFGGVSSLEPGGADIVLGPYTVTGLGTGTYGKLSTSAPGFVAGPRNFEEGESNEFTVLNATDLIHYQYTAFTNDDSPFSMLEENMDVGFVIGAAVGYEFDMGFRLELELSHRYNDLGGNRSLRGIDNHVAMRHITNNFFGQASYFSIDTDGTKTNNLYSTTTGGSKITTGTSTVKHTTVTNLLSTKLSVSFDKNYTLTSNQTTASARVVTDGSISTFAVMANIWYDFNSRSDSPIVPFVGAGIGLANLDVEYGGTFNLNTNLSFLSSSATRNTSISFSSETSDSVLAWQLGAGISVDLGGGMKLTAQYRYFATDDLVLPGGDTISVESHAALMGLQIPFGN